MTKQRTLEHSRTVSGSTNPTDALDEGGFCDSLCEMWGSLEDSMAFTVADNQAPPLTLNDGPQPLIKQATDKAKMALQSLQALKTRLIETISCAEDEGGDAKSFMDKTLKGKTDYVETLIKGWESIIQTKRIKDALGAPQPTTPQDIRNKMRADSKVADTLKAHITVVQGMLQS